MQSCEDCQEVTSSKTQKSFVKRELNLLDRSEKAVRITLWGGEAEKFVLDENNPNPVMAIKVGYTRALLEHNHVQKCSYSSQPVKQECFSLES